MASSLVSNPPSFNCSSVTGAESESGLSSYSISPSGVTVAPATASSAKGSPCILSPIWEPVPVKIPNPEPSYGLLSWPWSGPISTFNESSDGGSVGFGGSVGSSSGLSGISGLGVGSGSGKSVSGNGGSSGIWGSDGSSGFGTNIGGFSTSGSGVVSGGVVGSGVVSGGVVGSGVVTGGVVGSDGCPGFTPGFCPPGLYESSDW